MAETIYGRLPILNALEGKRKPKAVYLLKSSPDQRIVKSCLANKVHFQLVEKVVLDRKAGTDKNQGAVAEVDDFNYANLDEQIEKSKKKASPLVVMLDGIEDPVNYGSILRSCAAFSVDFVIVRKDRQVGITPTVVKVSTGATEEVPIVQVTNLSFALEKLKKSGYWSVAAAGGGDKDFDQVDYSYPTVLIIGNEGFGISDKVLKEADFIAKIPMPGNITSLNASVATAVFLAQIVTQRLRKKA